MSGGIVNTYETTINHVTEGDAKDEFVVIESSEKTVIHALETRPEKFEPAKFEKVWEDTTPGCPRLVRFRIPLSRVNWAGIAKRDATVGESSIRNLRGRSAAENPEPAGAVREA